MDDSDIVTAAQAGDRAAFGEIVCRYRGMVFGLCYRLAGNAADAEDLTHDAFVEAYLKLGQLREPAKFKPWLRTLTLNLCRMWYRRQVRDATVSMADEPEARDEPSDDGTALARLSLGLTELSVAHRVVLVLHYLEGLSYDEMATFLDAPVGTVMSRLHRARRALKRAVEGMDDEEDIPMIADETLKQEVDAEIDVLLDTLGEERGAAERLSVVLARSPERFRQLIEEAEDEPALGRLALLLPRLGSGAMDAALDACLDGDTRAQANASAVLAAFASRLGPECRIGVGGWLDAAKMAAFGAYVLLDRLIARSPEPRAVAELLVELMEASCDGPTTTLITEALLCFPDPAFDVLADRFWATPSPAATSCTSSTLTSTIGRYSARLRPSVSVASTTARSTLGREAG